MVGLPTAGRALIRGSIIDISERRRAEEALRESESRYRSVVENQTEHVVRWKPDGTRTFVNEAYCRYVGKSRDELVGGDFFHLIVEEAAREAVRKKIQSLTPEHPVATSEYRTRDKDNNPRWHQWTNRALFDEEGRLVELQSTGRDISSAKKAQQDLLSHQEKLKALTSQFALAEDRERQRIASVLHDEVAQTLSFSTMKLGALQASLDSPETRKNLEEVRGHIKQVIDQTRNLIFDQNPPILDELSLIKAIELLARRSKNGLGILCEVHDDGRPKPVGENVSGVLFQGVREALVNIKKHAKTDRARIDITRDNGNIEISIVDHGVGFDVARVGSWGPDLEGFGLFNLRERLDQLGGSLIAESEVGRGSKITLRAPMDLMEPPGP